MKGKTIFVTGVTGNQGGAVAKKLIEAGFSVKGLVRNPSSPKAVAFKDLGVELIEGNLDHRETFEDAIRDSYGVFCVLTYDYGTEKEIKQGLHLIDLATAYGVHHFVYSSVIGCDFNTGIPHWESKLKIEDHLKQSGMPYTIFRPASLYENFLIPQVKSRILKGKLSTPVKGNVIQQFISSHDIAEIATKAFMNPDQYLGKTLTIAAEEMSMNKAAEVFGEAMGRKMKYQPLPMFLARIILGRDLAMMFKWVNKHNAIFVKDLQAFRQEYPNLLGLKEWIKQNFKN